VKKAAPKGSRFVEFAERDGGVAYFDELHQETILLAPFLSKIRTPYGRRWVVKYARQSRSASSGAKRVSVLLVRAKNVREALAESAAFLKWKIAMFLSEHRARGTLVGE